MKHLIKNTVWEINKDYNKEKLLYLLIDRPDEINRFNDFVWFINNNKNQLHRDYDLPSYVGKSGYISWFKNNKRHREDDKPAINCVNGDKKYWINGKYIKIEFFK